MNKVNKIIFEINKRVEPCYEAQNKAFGPLNYQFLTNLILKHKVKKVLDVGTGEGSFVSGLAKRTKNIRFDAVDLNPDLIELAKLKNNKANNINFQCTHFNNKFPGKNYDLITARFAVEHMSNVESFIKTAFKKLKPKGFLIIIEYYVDEMHTTDPIWKLYRKKELAMYKKIKSCPRVSLILPAGLKRAKFRNIVSAYHHISPATVGAESFFNLAAEYAKIYNHIDPRNWPKSFSRKIVSWCEKSKKKTNSDPTFMVSHTIGQK